MPRRHFSAVIAAALLVASAAACSSGGGGTPPKDAALSGFGATVVAWDAAHTEDKNPGLNAGCCFDPVKGLGYGNRDRFTAVNDGNGIVDGYDETFAKGTTIAEAKAVVARSFPVDAVTLWGRALRACYQWQVASPTLAKVLAAPKIGDPSGDVFVEFDSSDASTDLNPLYLPNNVTHATVGLATSPTEAGAGSC